MTGFLLTEQPPRIGVETVINVDPSGEVRLDGVCAAPAKGRFRRTRRGTAVRAAWRARGRPGRPTCSGFPGLIRVAVTIDRQCERLTGFVTDQPPGGPRLRGHVTGERLPQSGFVLFTVYPSCIGVARGGSRGTLVSIQRLPGFHEPVEITVVGLPMGLTVPPTTIAGDQRGVLLPVAAVSTAAIGGSIAATVNGTAADFVESAPLTVFVRPSEAGLDGAFGAGGAAPVGPFSPSEATDLGAIAAQADGKLLVGASTQIIRPPAGGGPTIVNAVYRLTASGMPDASFGSDSAVLPDGGVLVDFSPAAVGLGGGGAVVVAGVDGGAVRALRFTSAGDPDVGFGSSVVPAAGVDRRVYALAIDSAQRVVVLFGEADACRLARFTASGGLDGAFGGTGVVSLAGPCVPAGLVIRGDDGVVVAGSLGSGEAAHVLLAALGPNGAPDLAFGTGGTNVMVAGVAAGIAAHADGYVVASTLVVGDAGTLRVARYDATGTVDLGFGEVGVRSVDFGAPTLAAGLAVRSDGRIVAVGNVSSYRCDPALGFARLTTDGTLDAGFADAGRATSLARRATVVATMADDGVAVGGGPIVRIVP